MLRHSNHWELNLIVLHLAYSDTWSQTIVIKQPKMMRTNAKEWDILLNYSQAALWTWGVDKMSNHSDDHYLLIYF